jgi:hypothetical protein
MVRDEVCFNSRLICQSSFPKLGLPAAVDSDMVAAAKKGTRGNSRAKNGGGNGWATK